MNNKFLVRLPKYIIVLSIIISAFSNVLAQGSELFHSTENNKSLTGSIKKFEAASINMEFNDLQELDSESTRIKEPEPLYVAKQMINHASVAPMKTIRLQTKDDSGEKSSKDSDSFFDSDIFYFIGAAAIATTFYFVWSDNDKTVPKKTFGLPPKP